MGQALHIFRKDVRYLRGEIAIVLALVLMLGYTETHLAPAASAVEFLVMMAMNYLIARVVHAEAIPGHNQFWITRPYRWQSLLEAKVLFVAAFVNLPMLVAQIYAIVAGDYSFSASLPGLVWSQILFVTCLVLPVICLASLTSGLISFLTTEFIVVGEFFVAEGLVHARLSWNQFIPGAKPGPGAMDWMRDFVVMTIVIAFAGFVLYSQYRTRNSEKGRKTATLGVAIAGAVFLLLPWPVMMAAQAVLSRESFDTSGLKVDLAPVKYAAFPFGGGRGNQHPAETICLPLRVTGLPANREAGVDSVSVTLAGRDGRWWSSGILAPIPVESAETIVDASLAVDPGFLLTEHAQPLTARAKIYVTLFGDPHSATIPIRSGTPVDAVDGLQCSAGLFNQLWCRSLFRWPGKRVWARTGEGVESCIRAISYSPFPAEMGFNPVTQHSFSSSESSTEAVITTKAALSHFVVEAGMEGVVADEYTVEAKKRAMQAPAVPGLTSK